MANLAASTYNGWYTTLNSIRSKHGQAAIATQSVAANTPALSSKMVALQNSINAVKTGEKHLNASGGDVNIPAPAAGTVILLSVKTRVDSILSTLGNICHHDSVHVNNSDRDTDDDYGVNWTKDNSKDSCSDQHYGTYKCMAVGANKFIEGAA